MTTKDEMIIPKSRKETLLDGTMTLLVAFFFVISLVNIINQVAVIFSAIWIVLVIFMTWNGCVRERSIQLYLAKRITLFAGRTFVQVLSSPCGNLIRFGYRFFFFHVFHNPIPISKIHSVEWSPGQATCESGRDMNDWTVFLWFDHDNFMISEKQRLFKNPDQFIQSVGPSTRKIDTQKLGIEFVDFLRNAGASLVQEKTDCIFSRPHIQVCIE